MAGGGTMAGDDADPNANLRRAVIVVAGSIVAASFIVSAVVASYNPPPVFSALAIAIVSWAVGKDMIRRNGGGLS